MIRIFKILFRLKKYYAFIAFFIFVIFLIRFPWNQMMEKLVRDLQKRLPNSVQTHFESLSMTFLPPGVEFSQVEINLEHRKLDLDSFVFQMDPLKWLSLKMAWQMELRKQDSLAQFRFWQEGVKIPDSEEKRPKTFLVAENLRVNLKHLNGLFKELRLTGFVRGGIKHEGFRSDTASLRNLTNLSGDSLSVFQANFKTPIGPVVLPNLNFEKMEFSSSIKEGEFHLKTLNLGGPKDLLTLRAKGTAALDSLNGRVYIRSYDLSLQIDKKKDLDLSLLDLMFACCKQDKGDFDRYLLRMLGQGGQVPEMRSLESF